MAGLLSRAAELGWDKSFYLLKEMVCTLTHRSQRSHDKLAGILSRAAELRGHELCIRHVAGRAVGELRKGGL